MTDINRIDFGTMGMRFSNRETSIKTIHAAFNSGITLFNTDEFYNSSESEMVTGETLKGIERD